MNTVFPKSTILDKRNEKNKQINKNKKKNNAIWFEQKFSMGY